jgi:alpha-tubulin suppressor-like RCC1 family protein
MQVVGDSTWAGVKSGYIHAYGWDTSGHLFCWGWGTSGQLGNGTNSPSNAPVQVSGF